MLKIKEAIIVEGRYDKNSLSQVVNALILETSGFGVFKDGEKLELIRRLAQRQGIIVLTDSDGAGFVIRNYLKGAIPKEQVGDAMHLLCQMGEQAYVIGSVIKGTDGVVLV